MSYNITLKKLLFNWKKTALPCCAGFCYVTTQLSCNPRSSQSTGLAPCVIQQPLTIYLF